MVQQKLIAGECKLVGQQLQVAFDGWHAVAVCVTFMADPAVLAVGVGSSERNPAQAVVNLYVETGRAHGPIPAELDGVRTQIIRTDRIRAYGWNEPQSQTAANSCPAKSR